MSIESDQYTPMILGQLMQLSNSEKMRQSGFIDLAIDDLWFKCPGCDQEKHSEEMFLIRVETDLQLKVAHEALLQPLPTFFMKGDEGEALGIQGIRSQLLLPPRADYNFTIIVRCIECARRNWEFEYEPGSVALEPARRVQ